MRLTIVALAVFGVTYAISWLSGRNKAKAAAAAAAAAAAPVGAGGIDKPLTMTPLATPTAVTAPVTVPAAAAKVQTSVTEQEVLKEVIGDDDIDATDDDSSIATPAVVAA